MTADQSPVTQIVIQSTPNEADKMLLAAGWYHRLLKPLTLDQWRDLCAQARMLMGWQIVSHSSSEGWKIVPPDDDTPFGCYATTQEAWKRLGETYADDPYLVDQIQWYLVERKIPFQTTYNPRLWPDTPYQADVGASCMASGLSNDQEAALVASFLAYRAYMADVEQRRNQNMRRKPNDHQPDA